MHELNRDVQSFDHKYTLFGVPHCISLIISDNITKSSNILSNNITKINEISANIIIKEDIGIQMGSSIHIQGDESLHDNNISREDKENQVSFFLYNREVKGD